MSSQRVFRLNRSHPQARSLVGYWPFGDLDYISGLPVLWQTAAPLIRSAPRQNMGGAPLFNGAKYGSCQSTARYLRSATRFTIMAWWYQVSTTAGAIFGVDNGFPDRIELIYNGSQVNAIAAGAAAGGAATPVGWNHAALTISGSSLITYYNGKQVATSSSATTTAATIGNLLIGRVDGGAQYAQDGGCEYRLYDRALSATEVFQCYLNPLALRAPASPGFVPVSSIGGVRSILRSGILSSSIIRGGVA